MSLRSLLFTSGIALGTALAVSSAQAQGANAASYAEVAAKAKPADGPPVALSTNYFLAWTGAWDSVILREREIWKKWLPVGSTVEWKRNLVGPPVVTELLAGKQQLGYIGDNPATASTTKREIAEIDLVAVNATSPGRMCGVVVVRNDAPSFAGHDQATKWLAGKTLAAPKGSCAERIGQELTKRAGIKVNWQQLAPEVTITSLQAGKIDAAIMFEPYASKAVFDGVGRFAISPATFGESDANAIVVRRDFIEKNRTAVVAWLKADIEAMLYLREYPIESVEILKKELPDYTRENLWFALYGAPPAEIGPAPVALEAAFVQTPSVAALIKRIGVFLHQSRITQSPDLPEGAIRQDLVREAFEQLGLDPNQSLFVLQTEQKNPFKGDARVP
jgi:NitT/TauT family transport system substrate-binding protein